MNRLLEIFKNLVSIASPTGNESELANFLLQYFSQRNILAEKDTLGNIFVRVPGKGEPLFLSAHMDTVSPGKGVIPVVKNGVIRSQGDTILGADNKATLAVILEVLEILKKKNHCPLEILFEVDEEKRNRGAIDFDYTKLTAKKGLVADIALPVGTLVLAGPAAIQFDISFIGKSGHVAFPEKAQSVLPALGALLSTVKTGQLDEQTTFALGVGQFGDVPNTIPGKAVVSGGIRSFDKQLLQKHTKTFFEKVETLAKKFGLEVDIFSEEGSIAYNFDKNDPYVASIANILSQQGIKPRYVKSWSISDANFYNAKGLQVVNIGDGTKDTHTIHESIAITDMEKLVGVFTAYCLGGSDQ